MKNEKGKMVFSKRFPRFDLDAVSSELGIDDGLDTSPTLSLAQFLERREANSEFVENPQKVKGKQGFIDLAKELSLQYEISLDIEQFAHYVQVTIYLYDAHYEGCLKSLFAKLFAMCDSFSYFANLKNIEYDLIISLDYHTHDHYLSGRKVNSIW